MTRTAAIVGGGIGGLAAAVGLHTHGWQVTVYERDEEPPTTGTGFGIWPEALRALDELGLGQAVRHAGPEQAAGTIRRPDGSRIASIDVERMRRRSGESVRLVSRPTLLQIMMDRLPPGLIRFGETVSDTSAVADDHDVVIAADGLNSQLRTHLFDNRYKATYAGSTVWRGLAPLTVRSGSETWGRGVKFGITPLAVGLTNWYAVISAPRGYEPVDGGAAELRRTFGSWHAPIPAIIDRYEESQVLHHDLYYLSPPLPTYVRGKVALLGDAAHAMTPDLGQGACQALIDGLVLARCLDTSTAVPEALQTYDRLRRPRTQQISRLALRASRMTQVQHNLALRDLALKLALAAAPPG